MKKLILLCLLLSQSVFASNYSKIDPQKSLKYLLNNIYPIGTERGIVLASPSKESPDYYFHWVRDAALVMNTVLDVLKIQKEKSNIEYLENLMDNYAFRVRSNQSKVSFENLGEPKYLVNGDVFTGPWGRPQHDGPALRAITLIHYANYLLDKGKEQWVIDNLYKPTLPALSPIKMDLEYTARYFDQQGFDYWEEVMGLHFSTAMAQRKALLLGAKLAVRLKDANAAIFYVQKADQVTKLIEGFWSPTKNFVEATIHQTRGVGKSQLDISTILGVLHGNTDDNFFSVSDPRIINTVNALEYSFQSIYTINETTKNLGLGIAIGRYPEDQYDGLTNASEGNPWFLATFTLAEYYLKLKNKLNTVQNLDVRFYCAYLQLNICKSINKLSMTEARKLLLSELEEKAMGYFRRADYHAGAHGEMSEQFSRENGYMTGARHLTWSYAAHLSATLAIK